MNDPLSLELWAKLVLAFACGAAIGYEREIHDKPAGLRTNMLICVGSTLVTMVSIHLALAYAERQVNIADPGRIAAQIVSGVGFLGAGTIIQARGSVHGLTTAATIWVMAGIGIAIGAGFFVPAVGATLLLVVILSGLGRIEPRLKQARHFVWFRVTAAREPAVLEAINDLADEHGLALDDRAVTREGDGMRVEFTLTCSTDVRDAVLETLLEHPAVREVRVNE